MQTRPSAHAYSFAFRCVRPYSPLTHSNPTLYLAPHSPRPLLTPSLSSLTPSTPYHAKVFILFNASNCFPYPLAHLQLLHPSVPMLRPHSNPYPSNLSCSCCIPAISLRHHASGPGGHWSPCRYGYLVTTHS